MMIRSLLGRGGRSIIRYFILQMILFFVLFFVKPNIHIGEFIWCVLFLCTGVTSSMYIIFSETYALSLRNQIMLPYERLKFASSLLASILIYVFTTKIGFLFVVSLFDSAFSISRILLEILIFYVSVILSLILLYYFERKRDRLIFLSSLLLCILVHLLIFYITGKVPVFLYIIDLFVLHLIFYQMNLYTLFVVKSRHRVLFKRRGVFSFPVLLYCIRNILSNKYYIFNSIGILAFGLFFSYNITRDISGGIVFAIPFGLALISLNTPMNSMVSSDKSLYKALMFLPEQTRCFFFPYSFVLIINNLISDGLFLIIWSYISDGVNGFMFWTAINFSIQSAFISLILEREKPYIDWKIESELWRHPRKYLSIVLLLLYTAIIGAYPISNLYISILIIIQFTIYYFKRIHLSAMNSKVDARTKSWT